MSRQWANAVETLIVYPFAQLRDLTQTERRKAVAAWRALRQRPEIAAELLLESERLLDATMADLAHRPDADV